MIINKKQALVLVKILYPHDSRNHNPLGLGIVSEDEPKSDFQKTLEGLCTDLDAYLLNDEEEDEDEEADDDGDEGEAEEESEEVDEEDGDESSEVEVDEQDEPEGDGVIAAGDLHDLKPVKSSDGSLEFECYDEVVDLLVDGRVEVSEVWFVKRRANALHVCDTDGAWYKFRVNRFPKQWLEALPAGDDLEVDAS